jgi:hypothetical protein
MFFFLDKSHKSNTISWNQFQIRSVLHEDIASSLVWVDSDSTICYDSTGFRSNFKRIGNEFNYCHKRCSFTDFYSNLNRDSVNKLIKYILNGSLGSEARVILNLTFASPPVDSVLSFSITV